MVYKPHSHRNISVCAGSSPLSVIPHPVKGYWDHSICLSAKPLAPLHCQAFSPDLSFVARNHASSRLETLFLMAQGRQFFSAPDTNFSAPASQRCSAFLDLRLGRRQPPFGLSLFSKGLGEWSFLPNPFTGVSTSAKAFTENLQRHRKLCTRLTQIAVIQGVYKG